MNEKTSLSGIIVISIAALLVSPVLVLITGYTELYPLSLLPLVGVVWLLTRLSFQEAGISPGRRFHYSLAVVYPLSVSGILVLLTGIFDGIRVSDFQMGEFAVQIGLGFITGVIVSSLTEEGFFRGVLWGVLGKKQYSIAVLMFVTGILFSLWHLPVIFITSEFGHGFPVIGMILYLLNILLIGLVWAFLRYLSGSILITSVSHSLWNVLAYSFFGVGTEYGVLVKSSYLIFDPERGIGGVILNAAFLLFLFRRADNKGLFKKTG